MMDLNELITSTDWTERELAEHVGVSQPTLNRVRNGVMTTSLGLVIRIFWHTAGAVTPAELPMTDQTRSDVALITLIEREGRVFE